MSSRRAAPLALVLSLLAVLSLAAGCSDEPTYCERVAVVFQGGEPERQLEAMAELVETTSGQEAEDWQALHEFVLAQRDSGAGDVSTSTVDEAITRLEDRVEAQCGSQ